MHPASFHRILRDPNPKVKDKSVKRVILCSGKVYYDIEDMRNAEEQFDAKIVRIEQLYPFPHKSLLRRLQKTRDAELNFYQFSKSIAVTNLDSFSRCTFHNNIWFTYSE